MYLSRAFRAVNLPASVLFLSAAASRRFLVDEGIRMGGRTGGAGAGGASSEGGASDRGVAWVRSALWRVGMSWMGVSTSWGVGRGCGRGCMGTSASVSVGGSARRVGVAGGVAEFSSMKSGSVNGGGEFPWSEDWYATMGGWVSCVTASSGTRMGVTIRVGI